MNIKNHIIVFGIFLILIAGGFQAEAAPEVFLEKGKYGLKDSASGQILHKAQFDSIGNFTGEYALVWKKNKWGVISKDGSLALDCKYNDVLLPEIGQNSQGEKYFWATKNGVDYYKYSNKNYYTKPYLALKYGPDKNWYGFSKDEQAWVQMVGFNNIIRLDPNFNPKVTELTHGYKIFNKALYSPAGKELLKNIVSVKTQTIGDNKFQVLSYPDKDTGGLIDVSNGHIWLKTNVPDVFICMDKGKQDLMKIINGKIFKVWLLDNTSDIFVIQHPQYNLLGLQRGTEMILPFLCTKIDCTPLNGRIDGKTINIINLEMVNTAFIDFLYSDLLETLKKLDRTYLVNIKEQGVSKLFNSEGSLAIEYEDLRIENNLLTFIENGEIERMNLDGERKIKGYDETFSGRAWNLSNVFTVVKKNGKFGIYREGIGEIIPPIYDEIKGDDHHFTIRSGNLFGMYDLDGKIMFKPQYKSVRKAYYNAPPEKNYYIVESSSGSKALLNKNGKVLVPFGTYDVYDFGIYVEAEKWCSVQKNGRLGIMDLTTFKNTVPCLYEPGTEQTSNERWPNRKIALARQLPNGDIVIDIYRMKGGKIASRTFSESQIYSMRAFMERQLNIELHIFN